jgi:putative transposase
LPSILKLVLSRNKVLSTREIGALRDKVVMRTLNLRKARWVVREMHKREFSVGYIAKQQNITPQYARRLYQKYKDVPLYKLNDAICLKKCGRKPRQSTKEEIDAVIEVKTKMGFGAVLIEKVLSEKGVKIPHNRVHRILWENGLAKEEPKKSRRRKWIRYERKRANSLWHTDWSDYKGQNLIIYEDDASRLITGFGMFKNATTENALDVYENAVRKWGSPKQLMSDHGSQFCADENDVYQFTEYLKSKGTEHILARVKHPQSNGKVERLFYTIKRLLDEGKSLEEAVRFYNEERPHMSLENGHLRTPLTAFYEKKANN